MPQLSMHGVISDSRGSVERSMYNHASGSIRSRIVRNLVIYIVGVMASSVVGGILLGTGRDEAALIFVVSPTLMAVLLRFFGGDGWSDAGLHLGPIRWYVFAFLDFPITYALILAGGGLSRSIVLRNMLKKDQSLSRYPQFEEYKK